MTLIEITDIGGGIIEVVYNDVQQGVQRKLLRKSMFWEVDLLEDLSVVTILGQTIINISYEQITKIGTAEPPTDNQEVYDQLKTMMIAP